MMNRFVLLFLTMLFYSCNLESTYDENLRLAYSRIKKPVFWSSNTATLFCNDWKTGVILMEQQVLEKNGRFDSIDASLNDLMEVTEKLNNCPSSRTDVYNDFVSIVMDVKMLCFLSKNPSYNNKTYSSRVKETINQITLKTEEFEMKYRYILKE